MAQIRFAKRQIAGARPAAAAEQQPPAEHKPQVEKARSMLSQAGGAAASGLHTLGSILSTPSRVLYGTINGLAGGQGGFGNMNPFDSTDGVELSHVLGNAGVLAKNDPSKWEVMDPIRGLIDVAGDPTAWLPPLALTKAGNTAAKAGTLATGRINQIRAGQRGLVGFRAPLAAESAGAIGSGKAVAEAIDTAGHVTGAAPVLQAISQSYPVTKTKEMFMASVGGRTTPLTQAAHQGAYNAQTKSLHDIDMATINSAQNMVAKGPIPGSLERHMAEMGTPTAEMAPVMAMKNAIHAEGQSVGLNLGTLDNGVKNYTRYGPKKAKKTVVRKADGSVDYVRINHGVKDGAESNEFIPNVKTGHVPRFAGEGVKWGGGAGHGSRKAMSSQAGMDQHRNDSIFGNVATQTAEDAVKSGVGMQKKLADAGLSPEQQTRVIDKMINKTVGSTDRAAGTNLTGYFKEGGREFKRSREMASMIQKNPQLAETGLFPNHPLADTYTQMASQADRTNKAKASLKYMSENARPNIHINENQLGPLTPNKVHNEPLDVLQQHGEDLAPTVLKAAADLDLNQKAVASHVFRGLPGTVRSHVEKVARERAAKKVQHEVEQKAGKLYAQVTEMAKSGMDRTDEARFNSIYNRYRKLHENMDDAIEAGISKKMPKLIEEETLKLDLPVKDYKSLTGFLSQPATSDPGAISQINSMFKANALAYPATQARNAMSASITNVLEGATNPLARLGRKRSPQQQAIDLMLGKDVSGFADIPAVAHLIKTQNISESEAIRRLAAVHFPVGNSLVSEIPTGQIGSQLSDVTASIPGREQRTLGSALAAPFKALAGYRDGKHVGWKKALDPSAIAGVRGHKETSYAPAMAANASAQGIEQANRLGGWLGLMRQGYDPSVAAEKIGASQVNYGSREFSQFEKKLKSVIPFYAFSSRSSKHVAKQLATDPGGRMAQVIKSEDRANARDESLSDSLLSGTSIPLGQRDDGTKTFLSGLGLAHEPASRMIGDLLGGDSRGFLYDMAGQVNPLLKTPMEHMTGQSFYQRGEPQSKLDPNVGRTLANLGVMAGLRDKDAGPIQYPGSAAVEMALGASPLSRLASTARTLTDTRKSLHEKALNTLTGLKVTDVSPKSQEFNLIRRAEEMAKASGAKSRSDVYFSKKELTQLERLDPALAEKQKKLQMLLNDLKKQQVADSKGGTAKKTKKARHAAGGLIKKASVY